VAPVRVSPVARETQPGWEATELPVAWGNAEVTGATSAGGFPPGADPQWPGGGPGGGGCGRSEGPAFATPRHLNRVTAVLLAGLVAVAGFAAGVGVQKRHDAGLTVPGLSGIAPQAAGFAGSGGFGGAGSHGGLTAGGMSPGVPDVVGRVFSVSTGGVRVTERTGAVVSVVVPESASVTAPGLGGLTIGEAVSVLGTRAADGTVTAVSVTGHLSSG